MSSADRSRDRRGPAWLPLAAAALVVPTALAGLTLLWPRPQIEAELARTASESLSAAGLTGAQLTFTGRDASIAGLTGADGQRAVEIVQGVTGVRVAQLAADGSGGATDPGASTTEPAPAAAAEPFGITRRGDDIVLTGVVGSEEERAELVAAATEQAGSVTVVDELTVTPGATAQEGVDAASVGAVAALLGATGDGVAATFDGGTLTLTGSAPDSASAEAAGTAIGAVVPGLTVDNQLAVDAATEPGAGASGELDDAGKQELQAAIDALVAGAPITFEPNSPALTAQGSATVTAVVQLVALVPSARLQVDGFVATGPGAGVLSAQELSDQRAAAVRDALVAGGVSGDNVTATGRGEGDSPAADVAGRRAAITVV